jgi:hypothetical protein
VNDKELLRTAVIATKDLVMKMIETGCFSIEEATAEQVAMAYKIIFDAVVSSFVEKQIDRGVDLSSLEF